MVKVNVISGFLGAGKTTLIKKLLAEALKGQKVILLENEYGEIGIDGGFMKDSGIQVTELNSGCICCTLAGDFQKAIDELIDTYHPDRILIEPSGVGKLSDIRRVVEKARERHDIELTGCATVVDAGKCRMYLKNFGEFFIDQIVSAETIILSRTQLVPQDKVVKAIQLIREHNAHARVITTPWDRLTGEKILETIEHPASLLTLDDLPEEHHHHHHHDGEAHDEHEHEHDHDHGDHDHDHDEHDHEHDEHEHGPHCTCGCHDHDADEVFGNFGVESPVTFDEETLKAALSALNDQERYGMVIRAKGIVPAKDGRWIHFDYTPGEYEIRYGSAEYTGRLCFIGTSLKEDAIRALFGI